MNHRLPIPEPLWRTIPPGRAAGCLEIDAGSDRPVGSRRAGSPGPPPTQVHQLVQAALLRPDRPETQAAESTVPAERRRAARPSQGVLRPGPAREASFLAGLHVLRLPA